MSDDGRRPINRFLTGNASALSWRYRVDWSGGQGDDAPLRIELTPDASTGGNKVIGDGMHITVVGNWEAHEFVVVLRAMVRDLQREIGGEVWDVYETCSHCLSAPLIRFREIER